MYKFFFVVSILLVSFEQINGHGRLMEPVNRGSAWRKGFKTPVNYDDDGNYCGGLSVHVQNGGKCGACGDNYRSKSPRANENTGYYGKGVIVRTYEMGQKINLTVELTANHLGFYRFAVCPLKNATDIETEECFAQFPLILENGLDRYPVTTSRRGFFYMKAVLPEGLICRHCSLRWEYVAGNNWGICKDGSGRQGCGQQETFRTCSDVRIL